MWNVILSMVAATSAINLQQDPQEKVKYTGEKNAEHADLNSDKEVEAAALDVEIGVLNELIEGQLAKMEIDLLNDIERIFQEHHHKERRRCYWF